MRPFLPRIFPHGLYPRGSEQESPDIRQQCAREPADRCSHVWGYFPANTARPFFPPPRRIFWTLFEYVDFYRIRQTHFFRHAPDAVVLIRIVRFTAQCSSDRTAQPCGGALRISFLHLTDDFCHRLQIADFFKCGKPFIQHLRDIFCPAKGTKSVFSAAVHFNRRSALRALCRNHTHCRSVLPCKFRSFY